MYKYYFVGIGSNKFWSLHPFIKAKISETHGGPVQAVRIAEGEAPSIMERQCKEQGEVYYYMFRSEHVTDNPNIKLIGPKPEVVKKIRSKVTQYKMARDNNIPVIPGVYVVGVDDAIKATRDMGTPVVVSREYGNAGEFSELIYNIGDIREKFQGADNLLITKYQEDCRTVSIGGVSFPQGIYLSSMYDIHVDGTKFVGSSFPTNYIKDKEEILEYARQYSNIIRESGYYGLFGTQWVFKPGKIFFTEANVRKPGATLFTTLALLLHYPDQPNLMELEFEATINNSMPQGLKMLTREGEFQWKYYHPRRLGN